MIFNEHQVNANYNKSKLAIISTWTSNEDCCLYQQCKKYNNGKNTRCFTYIDDAVNGIIEAENKNGGLYNCVNLEKISIKEFTDLYGREYVLTDKKRDKDNPDHEVDFKLPNILSKYIPVKKGLEKCH